MNPSRLDQLPEQEQDWIDAYLDGSIEPEAFEALQERMVRSAELRAVMRRYLSLDNSLQDQGGGEEGDFDLATSPWLSAAEPYSKIVRFPNFGTIAAAAVLAFILGLALMYWRAQRGTPDSSGLSRSTPEEPSAQGFAAIGKLYDVDWGEGESNHREGDTLGAESLRLASGTAEIQFFSGATMTVEGPADIAVKSAWEAVCLEGAVRMQVPPAARGFKLHAPSTEIVDLGTEFGLVVRGGRGHVEVFDGEIAIRHRDEKEALVRKGSAVVLAPDEPSAPAVIGQMEFPDVEDFEARAGEERRSSFERWQAHRDALAKDDRLLAYYTFDRENSETLIPNLTVPRNREFDGAVVLAEPVDGRWPGMKSALEFRRPGARVRVNIPGEFPAFTFMCWARIDSLDRQYNALFMGDGYENGEPHWQLRDDGKLMLSVMVDETRPSPYGRKDISGFHRVYLSPPIWNLSMGGQWLHLASVLDPQQRAVSHYVNGKRLSREKIEPEFLMETLRIGNGEIGNWGQPNRADPRYAIRNLNGRMDEFAIFRDALDDQEIEELFELSRSGRR